MNIVEGKLTRKDGRWIADGGGIVTAVDEERYGDALVEGRAVEVGVRPHDFAVCAPEAAAATLKVELVEALGFEAFAYGWLRASGPRIVARLEAADARRVKGGAELPLTVERGRVHLFDPETGRALDAR
jgi:ABC-type sugar transport system ATPase subunit